MVLLGSMVLDGGAAVKPIYYYSIISMKMQHFGILQIKILLLLVSKVAKTYFLSMKVPKERLGISVPRRKSRFVWCGHEITPVGRFATILLIACGELHLVNYSAPDKSRPPGATAPKTQNYKI